MQTTHTRTSEIFNAILILEVEIWHFVYLPPPFAELWHSQISIIVSVACFFCVATWSFSRKTQSKDAKKHYKSRGLEEMRVLRMSVLLLARDKVSVHERQYYNAAQSKHN